jgi:hypothetical protein
VSANWIIAKREEELIRSALDNLPALALADEVTKLLVNVIERVTIDASHEDRSAEDFRRHAMWFIAIIAVRAMRAAMRVLMIGYEEQSVSYQRLIDELHNRAQQIHTDESGDHARRWLDGRPIGRGPGSLARASGSFCQGLFMQTPVPS